MGVYIQKETVTLSGSALETGFDLDRGTGQNVLEVDVAFANAAAGDFVQLFRKDTASTADEQDGSHADSVGVLIAEGYVTNGALKIVTADNNVQNKPLLTTQLRVRISSSQSGTAYIQATYEYN